MPWLSPLEVSRLNWARRQLTELFVAMMLLAGCDGVGPLATGSSSSKINFGLSLNLDILYLGHQPAKPNKASLPETVVDEADKPAKNSTENAAESIEQAP